MMIEKEVKPGETIIITMRWGDGGRPGDDAVHEREKDIEYLNLMKFW